MPPKKAAAKKAAPRRRQAPPRTPEQQAFDSLSDEAKALVAKAILEFDEPGVCPAGRRRFLKEYGLPVPPPRFPVSFDCILTDPDHTETFTTFDYDEALKDRVQEALTPLGITVEVARVGDALDD